MNMITKTALTTLAIAGIAIAALSINTSDASAGGWKKFKRFHHFNAGYNHNYHCTPKFKKIGVWSPRKGRKVLRLVKVGKYCGGRYIKLY